MAVADVFVSYKAEDRRRVKPLVDALEADGLTVWWDAHVGGGDEWRDTIQQQLDQAKCVLVVWSKRSVGPEGKFVRDEATRADRRRVYLPARIDKVDPPLGFGETQALSLIGWTGNRPDRRYQSVLEAVRVLVAGTPRVSHAHLPESLVSRRFAIGGGAAAVAAAAVGGGWYAFRSSSAATSKRIAVLPFANLSGDPSQAYFSDGIAEELRSSLSRVGMEVIGRDSSEAVKNLDTKSAAAKLGVANILTGSFRRSSSTIRVDAQLVSGSNGVERWAQSYDRAPGDAIKIQTDIAENVASALKGTLGVADRAAITVGGTSNPEAQKLVLQANRLANAGMTFAAQASEANYQEALKLIDQALKLDPAYAKAYADKATLILGYVNHFSDSSDIAAGRVEATEYARKAISIAPDLPYAHLALSIIYRGALQLGDTERELNRSVALAPDDPEVLRNQAVLFTILGRSDAAIAVADRAIALDPLSGASYGLKMLVLFYARRYGDGVQTAAQTPKSLFRSYFKLGDCLTMLGRKEDALRAYESGPRNDVFQLAGEGVLAARTGDRAQALKNIDHMRQLFGEAASYQYAQIHAQLGQADEAFANLDRAWDIKDPGMITLKVDPLLDPLRKDRRYPTLEQKLGLGTT